MPLRNAVLASVVALLTLVASLVALRHLAPRLVGAPTEVAIVQSSEQVPPFYENVFAHAGTSEAVRDPVTVVREPGLQRARPDAGPTDLLGFRNEGVPNAAAVVVIGDSQTYGLGVALADSWAQRLRAVLGPRAAGLYNMSGNGWGPTQYTAMAPYAAKLHPKVVLVAYYTGNDPHDAFTQAYNNPLWKRLRVSTTLTAADQPPVVWPVPDSDRWVARFRNGYETAFTPEYRRATNDRRHPGVREGYDILAKTATVIARSLEGTGARVLFTVIPTKELVYAPLVKAEGLKAPPAYEALVADETQNAAELADRLRGMRLGGYAEVTSALQEAALAGKALYPSGTDGHPSAIGHEVLAAALARAVAEALASPAR